MIEVPYLRDRLTAVDVVRQATAARLRREARLCIIVWTSVVLALSGLLAYAVYDWLQTGWKH